MQLVRALKAPRPFNYFLAFLSSFILLIFLYAFILLIFYFTLPSVPLRGRWEFLEYDK